MSISAKTKPFGSSSSSIFYRLQTLIFVSQRSNHTFAGGKGEKARFQQEGFDSAAQASCADITTWKVVDSRSLGIHRYMVSHSSWFVMKVLQSKGFEAYLVGGCVRDLILKRTPKDFDVITTAQLKQVKKQFHRSHIVGRRFPICLVNIKGSVVEVSSFDTVAKHDEDKKQVHLSQMPAGCNKKDFILWRNSLARDFTINSLFYDPFLNKIHDYANGMRDLSLRRMRTVIPAQFSFKEDSARILRGLRIAARLGLSFSKETASAIRNLSSSLNCLDKQRKMMELNYMLSYGAAETSLCILRRFKLLEIFLPFHAAYLDHEAPSQSSQSSLMLMKLFSAVDKLLSCDRPSDCSLWVGLLAFHIALVNYPQDALVIWAFSSVLCHGNWREAVKFARKRSQLHVQFVPEIVESCDVITDGDLAEKVSDLASLVKSSVDALTDPGSVLQWMAEYPTPCTNEVFVSKRVGEHVAELFNIHVEELQSYRNERKDSDIDYELLGKGNKYEMRYVLGQVIMDTMSSGVMIKEQHQEVLEKENCLPESNSPQEALNMDAICLPSLSNTEQSLKMVNKEKLSPPDSINEKHQQEVKKVKCHLPQTDLKQQDGNHKGTFHQPISDHDSLQNVMDDKMSKKGNKHQLPSDMARRQGLNKKPKVQQSVSKQEQQLKVVVKVLKENVVDAESVGEVQHVANKGKYQYQTPTTQEQKQEPNTNTCQQTVPSQEQQKEVAKEKCRKPLSSLFRM